MKKELAENRELEQKSSEPDILKNATISIAGATTFTILTIIAPLLKLLGGFLTYSVRYPSDYGYTLVSRIDYYWDRAIYTWGSSSGSISLNYPYDQYIQLGDYSAEFIWQLIPLWGFFWIVLGIGGAVLVVIPPLIKITDKKQIEMPLAVTGMAAGLISSVIEYILFLSLLSAEDTWLVQPPEINVILLGCFIIGWVALIVGYLFSANIIEYYTY